jgi:hypothetical protein
MLPLIGLLMFLFFNGIFLAGAVIDLFTEPKSLDKAHLLVIPVALVPGLVFFRLGRQLFKKGYVDNEEAGIFSKVGFSAWVVFLLALSSFAGGACMMKSLTSGELSHQQPQVRLDRPVSQTTGLMAPGHESLVAPPSGQALRLQAIFYNSPRSSAIVNGKTVFIGEQVAGWTVKAIESKSVTLQNAGGKTNILWLK